MLCIHTIQAKHAETMKIETSLNYTYEKLFFFLKREQSSSYGTKCLMGLWFSVLF